MSTRDLGTLTDSTPKSFDDSTLTVSDPTDVYKFRITSTRNINLSLNEISFADDADLELYRDTNGNGRLDLAQDRQITFANEGSNNDDAINVRANAGTYFARAVRYAPGSSGSVTYDLDLSATPRPEPSNLLPKEDIVGDWTGVFQDQTFYGSVGNSNTSDVYQFHLLRSGGSVGSDTLSSITLSGLSDDADIRLIRDFNQNRIADVGEEITRSSLGGTANDTILNINQGGTYYLQVYQYSGNTNYTLNFDYTYVPPV